MRIEQVAFFIVLCACPPGKSGRCLITNEDDAPFDIKDVKSVLLIGEIDENNQFGTALVLLSSKDVDCGEISVNHTHNYQMAPDPRGTGLLLATYWYHNTAVHNPRSEFENLFEGYPYYDSGTSVRGAGLAAFQDGDFLFLGGESGGSVWVRFDRVTTWGASGSFSSDYWSGTFNARNCGFSTLERTEYEFDTGD